MNVDILKYPIGKFVPPVETTKADRDEFIRDIESFPNEIASRVLELTNDQLDTAYRPDGWTIRQVVHHLADSHLNSYIRFKWAVTEQQPLIKAYDEKDWACLKDSEEAPVEMSLNLLSGLHERWVWFLRSLTEQDWNRCFTHPETNKLIPLYINLALYAWHGKHHLAHINALREKKGW